MVIIAKTDCEHCGRTLFALGKGRIVSLKKVLDLLFARKQICAVFDVKTGVSKLVK